MRDGRGSMPWSVVEWPSGLARLHLSLLLAGALIIRGTLGPELARIWMARLTLLLRWLSAGPARVTFRVFGSRVVELSLSDDYWIPSVTLGLDYEPEVLAVLSGTLSPDALFIDAGANIGWWSLFASTIIQDPARVIAIEPARSSFADLQRDAQLNSFPFTCLKAAVWSQGGMELPLRFEQRARAGAHVERANALCEGLGVDSLELVSSVCIDEVVDQQAQGSGPLILKLDVEGAEIPALRGMREHLHEFDLIIYEDHGKDPECRVTAEMFRLGFDIYYGDRQGNMCRVYSLVEALAIKRDPRHGYNFFAVPQNSSELTRSFFAMKDA